MLIDFAARAATCDGMMRVTETCLVILASAACIAGLYFFREPLIQFALAALLWLTVTGIARWLKRVWRIPRGVGLALSGALVLVSTALVVVLLIQNVSQMANEWPRYADRLNVLISALYATFAPQTPAPTVVDLVGRVGLESFARETASGIQGVLGDVTFIGLYLAFIFTAAAHFDDKLLRMVGDDPDQHDRVQQVLERIRRSMEQYMWVQTVLNIVVCIIAYGVMAAFHVENAIFWTLLIFFVGYIPTIGPLIASVVPTLVALVQFGDNWTPAIVVGGVISVAQFIIGNIIQPRIMADSLNLSAIVVLLSLALWGFLWGIAGAFLSAPLTVALMIVLAQFPSTRWLAILLSTNNRPEEAGDGKPG